jgi:serine/threonine protein kinase
MKMAIQGLAGKTLGKYRLVEQLGRGGMAEVYKAYQPGLDRYVAVKVMHSFLSEDKDFLARFQREAKLVASMRHPNIVQVHDFDVESGLSYMVMEFIDGETLKGRLQNLEEKNQWISIDEAVRISLLVGSALKYAHRLGMVHRDVKPANVMIDKQGNVILTDFGIAKIFSGGGATQLTATGAMVGTPSYMAPEQGMGQPGDERSDIYSLGVMLYQLVTGRLPYEADTPLAVVIKHINESLPMPRQANPEVPESVERVILKAMAKNPDDRYQHVGEMLNDLKRASGMTLDETPTDTMRSRALPAGATAVGTGAITPFPTSARAAPSTVVGKPSVPTIVASTPAPAVPAAPARRAGLPAWIIVLIVLAVLFVGAIGVAAVGFINQQNQARALSGTATAQALAAANQPPTSAPTVTPTLSPQATPTPSSFVGTINANNVKLRQSPSESSADYGVLSQGIKVTVRQRTADSVWLRVETTDNILGWVSVKEVDLGRASLAEIPQSTLGTVPTATPNLTATAAACKPDAQVADVTVPDGSQFKPGDVFTKTWRFTSSGNCVWEKDSVLVFQSGDKLGAPDSVPVDVTDIGKSVDVSLNMTAPQTPGTYSGHWALQRPAGQVITATDVSIVVPAPTATRGPTPTARPAATVAAAATATPAQAGGIPPNGSGPFSADPTASGPWNCVRLSDSEWAGDFFIGVYGGPGNYTINDTDNCSWFASEKKFRCHYPARFEGAVNNIVYVSCPGCTPVKVIITGRGTGSNKETGPGICKAN